MALNSHGCDALPSLGVPQLHGLLIVLAARHHQVSARVPVHAFHICTMAWDGRMGRGEEWRREGKRGDERRRANSLRVADGSMLLGGVGE